MNADIRRCALIEIPFAKLHGAENDFLISWAEYVPEVDLPAVTKRICARTIGVGADGWMLAWHTADGLRTRLFNADGSEAEISGNGTRCAAAFAYLKEQINEDHIVITTAAGPKQLKRIQKNGMRFLFEMDMGLPIVEELRSSLMLGGREWDVSILNVGNPQCAIFVQEIPEDWRMIAAEAEGLKRFPNRSNVSIVKPVSEHAIEALFYERGAGETRSSGTGSTGAAVAAILRGHVKSPVEVRTPAGSLQLRWDNSVFLTGPAELICEGIYFLEDSRKT
jgi:diaminopimelate epimerase